MKIQKVQTYRGSFIVQLGTKSVTTRIETVDQDNKMKVRKSVQSAKNCITREINKRKAAMA
jgi:hypothetical protein